MLGIVRLPPERWHNVRRRRRQWPRWQREAHHTTPCRQEPEQTLLPPHAHHGTHDLREVDAALETDDYPFRAYRVDRQGEKLAPPAADGALPIVGEGLSVRP